MPTDRSEPRLRRRARSAGAIALGLVAIACEGPRYEALPDAHRIPRDVGPIDAWRPDAAPFDAPLPDGWGLDVGSRDVGARGDAARAEDAWSGGSLGVVVDGVLDDRAWARASSSETPEVTVGRYAGTRIERLVVLRDADELALGVEGSFPIATTTLVLYADVEGALGDGVLLQLTGLADRTGAVDAVLSNGLMAVESSFRPQLGFGAVIGGRAPTSDPDALGWRTLSPFGEHAVVTHARSACSTWACETVLELSSLGVPSSSAIRFIVRVGDAAALDLWVPFQTIPSEDDPEFVTTTAFIPGFAG